MTGMDDCNLAALAASLQGCVYTGVSGYEAKYFSTPSSGPLPTKPSPLQARQDASLRNALAEVLLRRSELVQLINDVTGTSPHIFIPDPAPPHDAAEGSTAYLFLIRDEDAASARTKSPEAAAIVLGVLQTAATASQPTDGLLVEFRRPSGQHVCGPARPALPACVPHPHRRHDRETWTV